MFDVAYTPGHASHHVSYFSAETGVAFVGDTAGVRLVPGAFVMPPTPPPDIDLESWRDSLSTIEAWRADTLLITHFGAVESVAPHLAELRDHLEVVGGLAKASLAIEEGGPGSVVRTACANRSAPAGGCGSGALRGRGRFDLNWRGLARWRS
jgi:glyoxylase-like metal-dependent hydrolase (beta-lactamase superfamily II)